MTGMTLAKSALAIQVDVAAGAAATTNIAVTGIATSDTLVASIESAAGVLTSRTAEASITSAGNIQHATTDTTGDSLLIVWIDNSL